MTYDLIIIGAGPGGYIAAERAGHHGLKTLLIEKEKLLRGTKYLQHVNARVLATQLTDLKLGGRTNNAQLNDLRLSSFEVSNPGPHSQTMKRHSIPQVMHLSELDAME